MMMDLRISVSALRRCALSTLTASNRSVITASKLQQQSAYCKSKSLSLYCDSLTSSPCGLYSRSVLTNNFLYADILKSNQRRELYSGVQNKRLLLLRYDVGKCCERIGRREVSLSAKSIVAASPEAVKPYLQLMRIDRPIGTWLVFMPCAWSISLAAPVGQLPDAKLLALCALGAFFMRGAGCTINDMWDKNFDAQVARTKDRPLPSGRVSQLNALVFLAMPLSASLAILLTLNTNTILLGFCSVLPCVIYPLMKRITYWPQVFLGIVHSAGAPIGWSAYTGSCMALPCLTLYLSCVLWTMTFDTIYSHQDKEDDVKIGVKSTALRFGESTKLWLSGFTACTAATLTATGCLSHQTWPYYLGVCFFTAHLGHQVYSVDLRNAEDCGNKFRSNRTLAIVFWAFIVASTLLKTDEARKKKPELASGQ